MQQYRPTD